MSFLRTMPTETAIRITMPRIINNVTCPVLGLCLILYIVFTGNLMSANFIYSAVIE